jgi:O-antigen/teichoic acid export membrane protein
MTAPGRTQIAEAAVEESVPAAPPSGSRSGVLLGVASAVSIVANYAFLLAAGRILGSADYGSLAALLGLLAVVLIPAGAVQMAVSREISRLIAAGHSDRANPFARAVLRLALVATVPLLGVAFALAAPLAHLLNIDSVGLVALTEFALATALVFPAAAGVLQGSQRFQALALLYVLPFILRLVLLAVVASAGFRLGGAVLATVAATIVGTLVAVALIREPLRRGSGFSSPSLRPFLRYLAPVAVGLVGIALLTHVDILIVKARFSGDDAGAYGAASAFARVGFFLPTTILAVLFPRTAARQARGEETADILGRSLLATAAFCGALVLFYLAAGVGLVVATFGADFAEGGEVLGPFALATGLFSLANILVGYHLSRGETRYAWIVAFGVLVQVAALSAVPSTLRGVVWTNVVIGAALIAAHELFAGSSLPALRAGLRRVRGATLSVRAFLPETGLIVLATTAFVCALFWPLVRHLGSTVTGYPGSDATATVAGFWEMRHEGGYHLLGITHHTFSGAPFGWDQSNALNAQVFLAYYPTYLVARVVGDIAAYNLTTIAGFLLSGLAMYLLVRYLRCAPLVAAWAALAFIVFPFHFAHEEHASLVHVEVLALLLLSLVAVAQRTTWLRLTLVGIANIACWLMSGYFGPMAAVTTIAFTLGATLTVEGRRRVRLLLGSAAIAIAGAGVLGLAAVASGTNSGAGLNRAVGDLSIFGIRPTDLLVPPSGNIVLGDRLDSFWAAHAHGANRAEIINYVGWLTILLTVIWLVFCVRHWSEIRERQRIATAGFTASLVAGLVFAAPSPVLFFGHKIPMPSRLLFAIVPAFRVLGRWDFMLMAALIPLAALGLQTVWRALAQRRVAFAVSAVGLAMVISFLELALHPAQPRFRSAPPPPEYAAVRETPRGIFADYPLGYSDIFRLWQRVHGHPLLNGAPEGTPADAARLMLLDPTQPGTAEALSLLGVTAIGIHPHAHVDAEVLPGNPATDGGYRLVGRFPDGASVWDVVAPAAPAFVTLPGGFATPVRKSKGNVVYPFISSGGVGVIDIAARNAAVVKLVFEAVPPSGSRRVLRIADETHEQPFTLQGLTRVSVLVQVPRGQSQLLVKTDPAATSEADAIGISAPRTEKASGSPTLQPQLLTPDPGF